jgi:type IV pilus assembly protein PilB
MMRADPDIIMVGEIRDRETAQISIEAALTGHLLLSTLHTNDAPSSITRLVEMGIESFLVASSVRCVVAQRLARVLCTGCKRPVTLEAADLERAGFAVHHDVETFAAGGCPRCSGSGYRGRIGVYEIMPVSDAIRDLALHSASADRIMDSARAEGMRTLREDAFEKVKQGVTSIDEVLRVLGG